MNKRLQEGSLASAEFMTNAVQTLRKLDGEANAELLQAMIAHERNELLKNDYVQSEDEILNFKFPDENVKYFNAFLDHITNDVFKTQQQIG